MPSNADRVYRGWLDENNEPHVEVVSWPDSRGRALTHIPHHSPMGFAWGYDGSGPSDLALAILANYLGERKQSVLAFLHRKLTDDTKHSKAVRMHQEFKRAFISGLPWHANMHRESAWEIKGTDIEAWLKSMAERDSVAEANVDVLYER